MNTADIVYKVWIPGQAPTTHSPALVLYSQAAVKFFVKEARREKMSTFHAHESLKIPGHGAHIHTR